MNMTMKGQWMLNIITEWVWVNIATGHVVEQFQLGDVRRNGTLPTLDKVNPFVPASTNIVYILGCWWWSPEKEDVSQNEVMFVMFAPTALLSVFKELAWEVSASLCGSGVGPQCSVRWSGSVGCLPEKNISLCFAIQIFKWSNYQMIKCSTKTLVFAYQIFKYSNDQMFKCQLNISLCLLRWQYFTLVQERFKVSALFIRYHL